MQIHAQVVVCPGINDGEHLRRTLQDLAQFYCAEDPDEGNGLEASDLKNGYSDNDYSDAGYSDGDYSDSDYSDSDYASNLATVLSTAIVPVGLTRFRPDLDELSPVSPADAQRTIDLVQSIQAEFQGRFGSRFAWLADEWFLIAGRELPAAASYEDYPQLENGVGSIRAFLDQFQAAAARLPAAVSPARQFTWVVGNVVEKAFEPLQARLNKVEGLQVTLRGIASHYWGQSLTVTGLLTGEDLIRNLSDQPLGDALLLPSVMLKHGESRFLDDLTVADVSLQLKVPIRIAQGIDGLLDACLRD
ncbi:MAG: DUF512 domain-containing protein [Synechococcales cyanobacterium RU_4_20]|nr:DUF512 domain-containing protein [Synechococcales cyanobacterium RU_4_20]NJR68990.1 DUF512 domain-containing protein [Synechococcales cyanobacterium CRU_2_2]